MNYFTYKEQDTYKVCFLVNRIRMDSISKEYFCHLNIPKEDILVMDLFREPKKKSTKASLRKEYLEEVKQVLDDFNIKHVVVCNGDYFKTFTKETKVDVNIGYVKTVDNYKVAYAPDFSTVFLNPPKIRNMIQRSISAVQSSIDGTYSDPGTFQFQGGYPNTPEDIKETLELLLVYPQLTCDIEAFSLKPYKAGIASIAFAMDQYGGCAFKVDSDASHRNEEVRALLKDFFHRYEGTLIFHNIAYDASVLIYQLYMNDITDTEGVLSGIEDILKKFEDTKLIAYLATNTCAGNDLGLKFLAQEFAGNYGQENISDVTKIPLQQLLEYNLKDCLSTWFVYNKYRPIMVNDQQEDIYKNLFLPSTVDIVQMQLTGFPLDMARVLEVEKILNHDQATALDAINNSELVINFVDILKQNWVDSKNAKLKTKRVTLADADISFNPRSHPQVRKLLFDELGLPVLNTTDSGLPSTDIDTLKALTHQTDDERIQAFLQGMIDFSAVDKILTSFIPAFKDACYSPKTDWYYLTGNFNLGGTVSGRLSSSDPNLQNLPATGSKYAKVVKSCFKAPPGWVLCGLDFSALEDHISALTTQDPNKLKVYLEHYDGHCLRAYSYFGSKMPIINAQLEEIKKDGAVYKVTYDSGEHKYFNEFNPDFLKLKE